MKTLTNYSLFLAILLFKAIFIIACGAGEEDKIAPAGKEKPQKMFLMVKEEPVAARTIGNNFYHSNLKPKEKVVESKTKVKEGVGTKTTTYSAFEPSKINVAPPRYTPCEGSETLTCEVKNLFRGILNRDPEEEEIIKWNDIINSAGYKELAKQLAYSNESKFNIINLYVYYLKMHPEDVSEKEIVSRQKELASGKTLYGLTLEFSKSKRKIQR